MESPFELQLAQNVIAHPSGGPVSLHATMLDGSPLPSWLHFDPAQQLFTGDGTAAAGAVGPEKRCPSHGTSGAEVLDGFP